MKLRYEHGLLFTDIKIEYNGKKIDVKDVVVDTGASHTIIDPDAAHEAGIKAEADDKFITSRGLGTAIDFALKLVEILKSRDEADTIAKVERLV